MRQFITEFTETWGALDLPLGSFLIKLLSLLSALHRAAVPTLRSTTHGARFGCARARERRCYSYSQWWSPHGNEMLLYIVSLKAAEQCRSPAADISHALGTILPHKAQFTPASEAIFRSSVHE